MTWRKKCYLRVILKVMLASVHLETGILGKHLSESYPQGACHVSCEILIRMNQDHDT
jgi:hypothetical protein